MGSSLLLTVTMLVGLLCIFLLPALGLCSSDCTEFSVGSCAPKDELPMLGFNIPDVDNKYKLCEDLCNNAEQCMYWSVMCGLSYPNPCTCSLYPYSYLHACNITAGARNSNIEVCLNQASGDCGDLVEEECTINGEEVGLWEEVTNKDSCLGNLIILSRVLGAKYFHFESDPPGTCRLFRSSKRSCLGMSGPRGQFVETCLEGMPSQTTSAPGGLEASGDEINGQGSNDSKDYVQIDENEEGKFTNLTVQKQKGDAVATPNNDSESTYEGSIFDATTDATTDATAVATTKNSSNGKKILTTSVAKLDKEKEKSQVPQIKIDEKNTPTQREEQRGGVAQLSGGARLGGGRQLFDE